MPKKLPKDRQTNADKVNRGRELSRSNDVTKNMNVGLLDIDSAIFYYFENVIKPRIMEAGEQVKVPVIYANPERWAAIQRQGYIRDRKRKIMAPAIAFRRTSMQKDESIPVDKLDPQSPKLFQTFQSRYSAENRYDKLSALKGIMPKKEMYAVSVPDYVTLSYDFTIWTSFTDQMNQVIERVNWAEGSYWGEPGKFRFRTSIDSFDDASEYEGNRRNIKTNFSVTIRGYLLPESFNPINTEKFITPKQVVIENESELNVLPIVDIDSDGAKSIRVISTVNSGPTTRISGQFNTIKLTAGRNLEFTSGNDFIEYNGATEVTDTLKIKDDVVFNTVTASAIEVGDNITINEFNVSGSMVVSGSMTVNGPTIFRQLDSGSAGLIVSGTMKIADAAIGEATKRAKLEIAGLGALGNISETNILDLGGDAFG
tara:strand:+ start:2483 stop:3763 length:1281 start_codon:yes stop_codon:yes gene_type:complete